MTPALVKTLDMVRTRIESTGYAPTLDEIAEATGATKSRVHARIADLDRRGKLRKISNRARGIELAEVPDMRTVPSDLLRAELARRGETLSALSTGERRAYGRRAVSCAADSCGIEVPKGHLFCRRHWFGLPLDLRQTILRTFAARDVNAYQDAVARARDIADGGRG